MSLYDEDPTDILHRDFGISMDDVDDEDDGYSDEPLPAGRYKVLVEQGDWKTTNAGKQFVFVRLVVVDGTYKGRSVFDNFWLWSANPKYQKTRLQKLRRAVGANPAQCGNLADLIGHEVMCQIKLQDKDPDYASYTGEKENKVVRYYQVPGAQAQRPAVQAFPAAPTPPTTAQPAPQQMSQQQNSFPTYTQGAPMQQQMQGQPQTTQNQNNQLNQNVQPSEQQQAQGSPF